MLTLAFVYLTQHIMSKIKAKVLGGFNVLVYVLMCYVM